MPKIYPATRKKCKIFIFLASIFFSSLLNSFVIGQTTVTYTTNGTFTVPAGVSSITVEAWGAGGGGSNITSTDRRGGGGGGGAYASSTVTVTPGNSYGVYSGNRR